MRLSFLFFLAVVLSLSNCNRKLAGPTNSTTSAPAANLRVAQVLRSIEANAADAEWMDAKAKVDIESDKFNIGGTAYIRLHRDKAIWMSVKKFGFEGARALIRPDSFFLYNRLQGDYIAEPLSYIEKKYKVPARFDLLQEIFLGNAAFLHDELDLNSDNGDISLSGLDSDIAATYLVDPATYRLKAMELRDLDQDRTLNVSNADYQSADGLQQTFPHRRTVSIVAPGSGNASMDMEFTDVTFGKVVGMPFDFR